MRDVYPHLVFWRLYRKKKLKVDLVAVPLLTARFEHMHRAEDRRWDKERRHYLETHHVTKYGWFG